MVDIDAFMDSNPCSFLSPIETALGLSEAAANLTPLCLVLS